MTKFNGRILMLGFGSVGQCTMPVLLKHLDVDYKKVTVIDFENKTKELAPFIQLGVRFNQIRVTPANMKSVLSKHLKAGDLLLDLAWDISAEDIMTWCHENGVLYLNTSIEEWDPYTDADKKHPTERTLYYRHMKIRQLVATWKTPGPTMVVEHGANPGLISHFTKQGLLDIATQAIKDKKFSKTDSEEISKFMNDRSFNKLAMKLGVKVVHISERDTQISSLPKQVDEFVNTWSIEGFREEGTTTSELGWGSHEKTLPNRAYQHKSGPKNQICLARMGINTQVVSYVPDYTIHGMIVRHGEAFTISDALTVSEGKKPIYRPTVHYAYCPCDAAVASLNELRGNDFQLQNKQRIMEDDITTGSDIMGSLILGHPYNAWWTGSDLSIEEARRLVPHQNATTVQVAISVVAATIWMLDNPAKGYCTPEDLPHDFILNIAKPYLGNWISKGYDWTPLKHRDNSLARFSGVKLDKKDPWQFHNFLLTEGE